MGGEISLLPDSLRLGYFLARMRWIKRVTLNLHKDMIWFQNSEIFIWECKQGCSCCPLSVGDVSYNIVS